MRIKLTLPVLFLLLLSLFVTSGCAPSSWKRSQQAYRDGDMVRAIEYSVETLRKKHGYEKAVNLLKYILEPTYDNLYSEAERSGKSGDWDHAYQKYVTIERISAMIATLREQPDPFGGTIKFPTRNVRSEIEHATREAAEMHYKNGRALQRRGRNREAARAFTMAMSYIPDYRDSVTRYNISREAALIRIAIMPFDDLTGQRVYGALGEILADQVVTNIMTDPANLEFLELVTRDRIYALLAELELAQTKYIDKRTATAVGKLLGIHSFVFGNILSAGVQYLPDSREVIREEAEISRGRDEPKETVHATVTVTTRRANARMVASYQVIDVATGSIIQSVNVPQDIEIIIEFATFRGDERALSRRSKQLVERGAAYPPPENDLIFHLTELVSKDLAGRLARFFNE